MVKKKAKKKVIKSKIVEGTNGHHRRIPGWFIFPSGEVVEISPSAAHEDSAYDNYPGVVCARVWAYGQGYKITEDTLMCLSHIPYRGRIKEAIRKWASDVITKWPDPKNIKVYSSDSEAKTAYEYGFLGLNDVIKVPHPKSRISEDTGPRPPRARRAVPRAAARPKTKSRPRRSRI